MGGKRKFRKSKAPAAKKRAVQLTEDVLVEDDHQNMDDIVEEKVSSFALLLGSLPKVKTTSSTPTVPRKGSIGKKPTKKDITLEEREIEMDINTPVPEWKGIKENQRTSLPDDDPASSDPEEEGFVLSEDDEEGKFIEFEEGSEEEEEEEEVGINHSTKFYAAEITSEHIEILEKQSSNSFSKAPIVQGLNDFYTKQTNSSTSVYYAPAAPSFDLSEKEPLTMLPVGEERKIKKNNYAETVEGIYMKKKLRTAFIATASKQIKEVKKKRKLLLSTHTGTTPDMATPVSMLKTFATLLPLFDQYHDIFYPLQTLYDTEMTRMAYILHVVNHTQKAREIVIKNSLALRTIEKEEKHIKREMKFCERSYYADHPKKGKKVPKLLQEKLTEFEETLYDMNEKRATLLQGVQDQGFTRPKTLILVPSQEMGGALVEMVMSLFPVSHVHHRKRFYEYFLNPDRDLLPHALKTPKYNALFQGNTNDTFYICLKMAQRALKLFADPYDSDIIIASPIGLRSMIDKKEDARGRHDFLSSIEICVLDLTDVFLMQNWSHVEFIFKHLNTLPELTRDTDFSRVKPYFLEGWAKYFRQTIVLSQYITPEIQGLFKRTCFNYQGKIRFQKTYEGIISTTTASAPQKFDKIFCDSLADLNDLRFNYFIQEIFPQIRVGAQQNHTLIYIPSYFDFVRLRNYFKQERFSFVSINEYTDNSSIARSRLGFFQGKTDYLLVTERFYFFRRYKIRGIKKLVFFAPPQDPDFYADFVNLLDESEGSSVMLYVKPFDQLALQRIVGNKRCRKMLASPKNSHMLIGGK